MRSKRSATSGADRSPEVPSDLAAAAIHSEETETLPRVRVEEPADAAGQTAQGSSASGVALHERPTMLLATIAPPLEGVTVVEVEPEELDLEPLDRQTDEVAVLGREREELRAQVTSLQAELLTARQQLADQQHELELLLPWLPSETASEAKSVQCSEVLRRIEPLRELLQRLSRNDGRMSAEDKLRWLLFDAEKAVSELRKLCGDK
jgi:hypothetical protein